jgi:hypothetical protein
MQADLVLDTVENELEECVDLLLESVKNRMNH